MTCLVFLTRLLCSQHKYSIPNLRPVPLDTPLPSPEPELRVQMPVPPPPRTMTLPPALKSTTSTANPAANTMSPTVRASGSAPFDISKPPMPRFSTPSTTQQTGQTSKAPQKKVTPTPISSKSVESSVAALLHQVSSSQPVDTLKSKPLPGMMFIGFDKSMVDDNSGWVSLPWFNGYFANDFRLL